MARTQWMQFQRELAFFIAPSLLGIKCANLVSLSRTKYDLPAQLARFNRATASRDLHLKLLCTCRSRALVLHYNRALLTRQLAGPAQQAILQQFGYAPEDTLESKLDRLAKRIRCQSQFPHEIGVFLGYPPEDVLGFIAHNGEKYKLCGYWKVYGDAEQARRTFQIYDMCRNYLCKQFNQGYDIVQTLNIS